MIITGSVSDLEKVEETSGSGDDVNTSVYYCFNLNGKKIKLGSIWIFKPKINNGDNISVSGEVENNIFRAYAMKNFSNNTAWNSPYLVHFVLGIFIIGGTLFLFTKDVVIPGVYKVTDFIALLLFNSLGGWMIYSTLSQRKFMKDLSK